MALKKDILQNFFNTSEITQIENQKSSPTAEGKDIHAHYRVFDNPISEDSIKLIQSNESKEEKGKPKIRQTRDKHKSENKTKIGQRQDNNRTKQENKINLKPIISDKSKTKLQTKLQTNIGQIQDKTIIYSSFTSLVGLQRKLIILIYEACKFSGEKITNPISLEHLIKACKSTKLSVQKSIQRLEKKGTLIRNNYKTGRGGWTQYELPVYVYQEIMQHETNDKYKTNIGQIQDKDESKIRTEIRTMDTSSSSNINQRTTTTVLPEEWETFDLSEYSQNFGFTKVQLKQLYEKEIPLETIQQSLIEMNYDVTTNQLGKIHSSPVNMLMGLLRAGKQYASSYYQSEFEKIKKEMTERIAQRNKADLENCFLIWLEKTDKAEIKKIIYTMTRSLSFENVYEAVGIQDKEIRVILLNYYTQIHKDYVLSLKQELQRTSVDNT